MKKALPIIVILILLALLGVGGYFLMNRSKTPAATTSNETQMVETKQETGMMQKRSTFRDLLGLKQNLTCTYSDPQSQSVGTMYMSGEDVRTDFDVTTPEGTSVVSHMITDGVDVYIWTDGQTLGYKQTLLEIEDGGQEANEETSSESKVVDVNQEVDYECGNWTVDNSKFALPSGVEFKDFSSMMQDAMEQSGMMEDESVNEETDPCSACDLLQGETKTQCLQALGC